MGLKNFLKSYELQAMVSLSLFGYLGMRSSFEPQGLTRTCLIISCLASFVWMVSVTFFGIKKILS